MAKGDDAVTRKKNKARRKKNQQNEKSSVSARVASIIAAKKRRLSGKRRKCQGMCFSLPTADDPFNERHGKSDVKMENKKKISKKIGGGGGRESPGRNFKEVCFSGGENQKISDFQVEVENSVNSGNKVGKKSYLDRVTYQSGRGFEGDIHGHSHTNSISDNISKFLLLCLDKMDKYRHPDCTSTVEVDNPLYASPWGVAFLKCYLMGQDIVETSGSSCTDEKIAWIVSVASDAISIKEKKNLPCTNPFLLFIVPSQEKAFQVRHVCKSLKILGIHTVSLHPGAALDHQIHGLKSCEPEFLVSTPGRLLELVKLKAIDISGVSFLVIDGLESFYKDGCLSDLISIRQAITENPVTVVFHDFFSHATSLIIQNVFAGPINRLSLNDSIPSQSACITQTINVCTSKNIKGVDPAYHSYFCSQSPAVLCIVRKERTLYDVVKAVNASSGRKCKTSDSDKIPTTGGKLEPAISVINAKDMYTADLSIYETVILPEFVNSTEEYVNILTKMARHTAKGILHSFLTEDDAALAEPLIQILEQCGQLVPEALRSLHLRSSAKESE